MTTPKKDEAATAGPTTAFFSAGGSDASRIFPVVLCLAAVLAAAYQPVPSPSLLRLGSASAVTWLWDGLILVLLLNLGVFSVAARKVQAVLARFSLFILIFVIDAWLLGGQDLGYGLLLIYLAFTALWARVGSEEAP